ncbi:DUF7833 domain-containing protein [Bacteroides graminisolvens]
MKNSQYFLHDCCARNNAKMLSLTADKGLEGYGAYWVLLEYLREQSDYCMPLSLLPSLAKQLGKFTQWVEELVCNYGLFVLTDDGRFTSQGLQQRMKPLENKRKARDAKAEKAARKKAVNSNTNSSFSAAQKTETNEKNSAKKVENRPLQLVDNEPVANASLEEKRIEEKRIEEIKRKEKEATASEKESSSSKSSFWESWLNEALGERSWLELQAIHSGLSGAFLPHLEVISKAFREHVLLQGTEVTICSLRDVKSYFSNFIRQGTVTNKRLRELIEKAATTDVYRFEQLVDGQRTYCGLPIPEGAPPRPAVTSVWDERKHCWEY